MELNLIKRATHIDIDNGVFTLKTLIIYEKANEYAHQINLNISKPYVPSAKDKLFFMPGCTIPRFKVKQFCLKYKCAVIRDKTKANIKFIGKDSIKELLQSTPGYAYFKSDVLKILRARNFQDNEIIKQIEQQESIYVFLDYFDTYHTQGYFNQLHKSELEAEKIHIEFKSEEAYNTYIDLISNNQYYDQSEILTKINPNATINAESYNSIKKLLHSTDIENIKVAMECMANSDFEQSCVPLLLLIEEFGDTIWKSPTRNHVNFKALLNFFEINNLQNFDLDDIMKSLLKRKLLSKSNLDLLMPLAMTRLKESSHIKSFDIAELKPSNEIIQGLKDNILEKDFNTEIFNESSEKINPNII